MKSSKLPFNVVLLDLSPARLAALKPVTSLDIYDGISNNFHEEGLFSVSIFGRLGEDERTSRFSFINLRTPVLHPIIYTRLCRLKGLYKGIMSGREFAVWDNKVKDFLPASELEGSTGYQFFMSKWKEIEFTTNDSSVRAQRVEVIKKYKSVGETTTLMVLPAGLRDIHVDESGRTTEDEINSLYRRVISIANTISISDSGGRSEILNNPRHQLQLAFNEIYEMLENMLTGKSGFIQRKWGSRRIFNGTRNVISAMDTSAKYIGGKNSPKFTDSAIGLYQVAKGALPLTMHYLLTGWLSSVFGDANGQSKLVNRKTLKTEYLQLQPETLDRWKTTEGLEKLISSYGAASRRHLPIVVDGCYIGLIYIDDKSNFKIFNSIEELPEGFNPEFVSPINLCQLLYLSGYRDWNKLVALITRYPIIGMGSIYPSRVYVKTTVVSEMRWELGEDWQRIGDTHIAVEFPVFNPLAYVDSLIPHPSRLDGLDADFDGDTASANILYGDDSLAEMNKFFSTRGAYLKQGGGFTASCDISTVSLVLRNMTGDPK